MSVEEFVRADEAAIVELVCNDVLIVASVSAQVTAALEVAW